MTSRISDSLRDLAPAFRRIKEAFAPHRDGWIEERSRNRLEEMLSGELLLLYRSCYAFARDLITIRTYGRFALFNFDGSDGVDEAACEAMLKLFGRRLSRTGSLAIVGVVDSLFEKNPAPTHEDIVRWLRGTVTRLVNNLALAELAEKNPQYVKTARKVERYVRGSESYTIEKSVVRLNGAKTDQPADRMPTAGEIVSLCGRYEPLPTNVPSAIDLIFELLAEERRYRPTVPLAALREAVFALLEARIDGHPRQPNPVTPYEVHLVGRAGETAQATLEETERGYAWRGRLSDAEKAAFLKAGEDYLFDLVCRGGTTCSERSYLTAHIDGCTSDLYTKRYKGSFHNFLQHLETAWRKGMKAE